MSFVGGKLKLKGGVDVSQLKGGVRKKKKKQSQELAVVDGGGEAAAAGGEGEAPKEQASTLEGKPVQANPAEDKRTEAEKKLEAHRQK